MNCCNRSTFGIAIASVNILIYIGVGIGMTLLYRDSPNKTGKFRLVVGLLGIVCLAMIATSGLFIFGIIKRLHKFIYPWLVTSAVAFVCNCGRALFALILAIKESTPFQTWFSILAIDVLVLGKVNDYKSQFTRFQICCLTKVETCELVLIENQLFCFDVVKSILVVQGLIFWPICTLYRDIKRTNNRYPEE